MERRRLHLQSGQHEPCDIVRPAAALAALPRYRWASKEFGQIPRWRRQDGVVPFDVELVWMELYTGELIIIDISSKGTASRVEFCQGRRTLFCGGFGDPLEDHLLTDQRSSPPVLTDAARHPALDRVPPVGSGRNLGPIGAARVGDGRHDGRQESQNGREGTACRAA
jgi:hypothetical protein